MTLLHPASPGHVTLTTKAADLARDVTGRLAAVAGAIARLVRPQRKSLQVSLIVFIGSSSSYFLVMPPSLSPCGVWLCRAYHGDERLDLSQSLMGAVSELLRPEMPNEDWFGMSRRRYIL
jgi:hypothetical protein